MAVALCAAGQALAGDPLSVLSYHPTPMMTAPAIPVQAQASEAVQALQQHLTTLGLYAGRADGIWGPATARAADDFLARAGRRGPMDQAGFDHLRAAARLFGTSTLPVNEAIRLAPRLIAADAAHRAAAEAHRAARYDEAETAYAEAIALRAALMGEADRSVLIARHNRANALAELGRAGEAADELQTVLRAQQAMLPAGHEDIMRTLPALAGFQIDAGRHEQAEATLARLLALQDDAGPPDSRPRLVTLHRLATLRLEQGRYAEAEAGYAEVATHLARLEGPDHRDTLAARGGAALAMFSKGHLQRAEREMVDILARYGADPEGLAEATLTARSNLASLYQVQGRLQEAEQVMRQVLTDSLRILGERHPDSLRARNNLGTILWSAGRPAEAEPLMRAVLQAQQSLRGREHPLTLRSQANLGNVIADLGRLAEAIALHQGAADTAARVLGHEHRATLTMRSNLSRALLLDGQPEAAAAEIADVLAARQRILGKQHPETLTARDNLAEIRAMTGQPDAAIALWRENLAHLPAHVAALGHDARTQATLPIAFTRFLVALEESRLSPDERAALGLQLQGWSRFGALDVSLAELGARLAAHSPELAADLRGLQDARRELAALREAFLDAFGDDAPANERASLSAAMGQAEADIARRAEALARSFPALAELELPRALTVDEAQVLLEPGEGLLAFASLDDRLLAWLVTKDRVAWHRIDAPRTDLAEQVARLRASLDIDWTAQPPGIATGCALESPALPDHPFDLCAARALHETLLGEIDVEGITELIVVPDGPLESLPFAMLVSENSPGMAPRWLVADQAVTTLPTTSSLRALRQRTGQVGDDRRQPFLGLAPVEFDADNPDSALRGSELSALPGTADEVRFLAGLMSAGDENAVIGAQASEAFVKTAPLERYRVLSFATHGLLAREAEAVTDGIVREMSLALRPGAGEDGLLTASEVAALRLNADWVLLSACNTAGGVATGGDGAEGLSGLARAFFFAGARSLMVSHWPIDDAVTPQLMADTMARSSEGMSRAQALRQAQLAMASRPEHAHPFFWAPFSVVGENR